jgi:purine-binding chemotaxis protein CheW
MLTFRIGEQKYSLPLSAIREVIRLPALTRLQGAAPFVCGLINLRSAQLPILDGRTLLGEEPQYALHNMIIVLGETHAVAGLLVDMVFDVELIDERRLEPLGPRTAANFLRGTLMTPDGTVIVFDAPTLLGLLSEA